jgi:hypothetical protein
MEGGWLRGADRCPHRPSRAMRPSVPGRASPASRLVIKTPDEPITSFKPSSTVIGRAVAGDQVRSAVADADRLRNVVEFRFNV